jgi:outer membrane protein OmpA-like peptidoglycan-associated protein
MAREALDQVVQTQTVARQALDEAKASEKRIEGKVIETVTLTNDNYVFPLNSVELDGPDRVLLDKLAERLKTFDRYHLVIQGHTSDIGYDERNYLLGEARANAVRRYLNVNDGIPLRRMSTISFGAASTDAAKTGGEGKNNRRIVILVLK